MTTPYNGDLERKVRELGYSVGNVESSLRSLRDEFEEDRSGSRSRLDTVQLDLRERKSEAEDLDERADGHDEDIVFLRRAVGDLGQRIAWLERRVRTAAGGRAVDLDATDHETKLLVKKIAAGRAAEAQLLPAADRARHVRSVNAYQEAAARQEKTRAAVLEAAATLATAAHGSDAFTKATDAYRQSRTNLRATETHLGSLKRTADTARTALDRDESLDQTLSEAAAAGQSAHQHLTRIARARISAALAGTDLLPVWFAAALGPMPPREDTEAWLDTATRALTYRLSYSIRDEVLALGSIPAQATARQRADHQTAEQGLRR
ncbi:hypothetical protein [Kitasatospora sp. NBC_01300]|uniref:hypothetical protein n=1 Tax=Kitasatospora sp. NBC_01300 TaxID=2903574 RepID=UPI002F912F36|nr:hypothetical protein OG556_40545 [Kitasatospora sp. NBC_01300]